MRFQGMRRGSVHRAAGSVRWEQLQGWLSAWHGDAACAGQCGSCGEQPVRNLVWTIMGLCSVAAH
jgi:hypothetical protein